MKLKLPDKLREPVKLRAPKLRKSGEPRAPRAPRAKSNVKAPKFATDLYSDLRDRRLLIPAIALVVALIAVPLLLGGSSEPVAPPPPVASTASDEAAAVQSAVLIEDVGIRDYRKRLAALKATNPFEQKFALPTGSGSGGGGGGGGGSDSGSTTAAIDDAASSSSITAGADSSVTETIDNSVNDVTEVNETTVNENGSGSGSSQPIRFYAGRVDVTVGPLGETKKIEGVRYLTVLPGKNSPVVVFLGLGEGGDKAVFSVSSDVAETSGEGYCAPKKPARCQYLTMKVGDQRTFKYENGKTFRLRLLDAHVVRVPDPRKAEQDG